jgi:hypothetical protein
MADNRADVKADEQLVRDLAYLPTFEERAAVLAELAKTLEDVK